MGRFGSVWGERRCLAWVLDHSDGDCRERDGCQKDEKRGDRKKSHDAGARSKLDTVNGIAS